MAFCPNCGTPNTDQADKCAACGFELASKSKGKFKGTIMMSGVKASGQQAQVPSVPAPVTAPPPDAPPDEAPDVEPLPSRPSVNSAFARHSSYAKTMLGHVPNEPELPELPRPSRGGLPAVVLPSQPRDSLASTLQGRAPSVAPPAASAPPVASSGGTSVLPASPPLTPEPAPRPSLPREFEPVRPRPTSPESAPRGVVAGRASSPRGPGKMVLIGCAGALAVGLIIAGLLYYALAPRVARWLRGGQSADVQAQAWHAQLSQALTQVTDLCRNDCQKADVFFHPAKQMALLGEAKALTPQRVLALADPSAKAEMLDRTDDAALASELALDPSQCVRVLRGTTKVISCSVPEPNSQGVLRIIHLSGIGAL